MVGGSQIFNVIDQFSPALLSLRIAVRVEGLQWLFRSRIGFRLLLLLIVAVIATIMSIAEFITDIFTPDNPQAAIESNEILMAMENNPESVTRAYYEAIIREDVTALGAIVCSADQAWLAERIAEFENLEPERVSVDFSATSFSLDVSEANQTYVSIQLAQQVSSEVAANLQLLGRTCHQRGL